MSEKCFKFTFSLRKMSIEERKVISPITGRWIGKNGKTFKDLVKHGILSSNGILTKEYIPQLGTGILKLDNIETNLVTTILDFIDYGLNFTFPLSVIEIIFKYVNCEVIIYPLPVELKEYTFITLPKKILSKTMKDKLNENEQLSISYKNRCSQQHRRLFYLLGKGQIEEHYCVYWYPNGSYSKSQLIYREYRREVDGKYHYCYIHNKLEKNAMSVTIPMNSAADILMYLVAKKKKSLENVNKYDSFNKKISPFFYFLCHHDKPKESKTPPTNDMWWKSIEFISDNPDVTYIDKQYENGSIGLLPSTCSPYNVKIYDEMRDFDILRLHNFQSTQTEKMEFLFALRKLNE